MSESPARYRLALLAAGLLWSLGGLLIKSLPVSALGITCYRSLFAALCLVPLLRAGGRRFPSVRDSALAILCYALLLFLYIASAQGTSAANAIFLQYTAPIYALMLGPLVLGEKADPRDRRTLSIAMAGMALLFLGNFRDGERLPLLLGLGSGLMFGLFILWLRRLRYADPVAVTLTNNVGVAIIAALVLAVVLPADLRLIPRALTGEQAALVPLGLLVLMGVVQFAIPYVLFSYGLRGVGAAEASLILLVEPLLNPFWVALGVREFPTAATLAGGLIIVAALVYRYAPSRTKTPPTTARQALDDS